MKRGMDRVGFLPSYNLGDPDDQMTEQRREDDTRVLVMSRHAAFHFAELEKMISQR